MRKAYVIAYTALKTGKTWESGDRFLHASTVEYYIACMSLQNARQGVVASLKAVEVADDVVLNEVLFTNADAIPSGTDHGERATTATAYAPLPLKTQTLASHPTR